MRDGFDDGLAQVVQLGIVDQRSYGALSTPLGVHRPAFVVMADLTTPNLRSIIAPILRPTGAESSTTTIAARRYSPSYARRGFEPFLHDELCRKEAVIELLRLIG